LIVRIRETKWHQYVKKLLKEFGKEKGFDVSESETEMYFTVKYKLSDEDSAEKHVLTYKPDVVWKKEGKYVAIFEIEYLNPKSQFLDKKKYVLGTFLLGLTALHEKLCPNFILVTNKKILWENVKTCYEFLKKKKIFSEDYFKSTEVLCFCCDPSNNKKFRDPTYLKKVLNASFKL